MLGLLLLLGLLVVIAVDKHYIAHGRAPRWSEGATDVIQGLAVVLRGVWAVAKWVAIIGLCCTGAGIVIGLPWMLYEVAKAERANWMHDGGGL